MKIDFPGLLDLVSTLGDWQEVNSTDGEHFFKTKDCEHEATVTIDDDFMEIEVDGEIMYSGEFADDEQVAPFIMGKAEENG